MRISPAAAQRASTERAAAEVPQEPQGPQEPVVAADGSGEPGDDSVGAAVDVEAVLIAASVPAGSCSAIR